MVDKALIPAPPLVEPGSPRARQRVAERELDWLFQAAGGPPGRVQMTEQMATLYNRIRKLEGEIIWGHAGEMAPHSDKGLGRLMALTGHRYFRGGKGEFDEVFDDLLVRYKIDTVYCGMAVGFDQWACQRVLAHELRVIACIPFVGQDSVWPIHAQRNYERLLREIPKYGGEVRVISEGGYDPDKMHVRNRYMVDRADFVLAYYDGSPGGTGKTVQYARWKQTPVLNLLGA